MVLLTPERVNSYEALGVTFDTTESGAVTINFNKSDLMNALAAPTALQKSAIQTMRTNGTGDMLAVGVSIKAPEGAKSVKFMHNGSWAGLPLSENGYFIRWFVIAKGSFDNDGNFLLASVADPSMKTVTMQFYDGEVGGDNWEFGNQIGGTITRDVEIVVAP